MQRSRRQTKPAGHQLVSTRRAIPSMHEHVIVLERRCSDQLLRLRCSTACGANSDELCCHGDCNAHGHAAK